MRLHRFRRIHVDVFHEPARLVGADREQREVDRPQASADLAEMRSVSGIAGEEDSASGDRDDEASPQRAIAVERAARREVLRRRQRYRERRGGRGLPPVEFFDPADAGRSEQPAIADRRHDQRMKAPVEQPQDPQIAVIVVIVTQEHE